ncbi:galactoside alpha-(1,2)-fucosyltransferase 1-like isoform X1 [Tubulanus polymorphus]|uniref:galactoside alpha-(1,2)-fucosyltransferase 1-like isoform X1 n=1 Tax=Tubulanus polymorphus TaxID=672921 RepID=UPI003DA4BAEB
MHDIVISRRIKRALILLIIVVTLLTTIYLHKYKRKYEFENSSLGDYAMTVKIRDRLGNNMFQYASLLGIAYESSVRKPDIYLVDDAVLWKYFKISKARSISRWLYDSWLMYGDTTYKEHCCQYSREHFLLPKKGTLLLDGYFQSWRYFSYMADVIRQEFRFVDNIDKNAADFIQNSVAKIEAGPSSSQPYTYIGVHVRRGDIMNKRWTNRGMKTAGRDYFHRAFEIMKRKYNNIVFVVCSNDIVWCKNNVGLADRTIYSEGHDQITDMAILSKCNHTILTTGSFGFFSAFLANGTTIYYGSARKKYSWADVMFKYEDFFMPNWIKLSDKEVTV